MTYLNFVCRNCGTTEMEEVVEDTTLITPFQIRDSGEMEYDRSENYEGEMIGYRCSACGFPIGMEQTAVDDGVMYPYRITDPEELAQWLLEQPYNQEVGDES